MKKNEPFKIDQTWWSKNKPKLMKKTGLGAAMGGYAKLKQTAMKVLVAGDYQQLKNMDENPFDAALAALNGDVAAKITVAKAAAKSKVFKDTLACLNRSGPVLSAEKAELAKAKKTFLAAYGATSKKVLAAARKHAVLIASLKTQGKKEFGTAANKLKGIVVGEKLLDQRMKKGTGVPKTELRVALKDGKGLLAGAKQTHKTLVANEKQVAQILLGWKEDVDLSPEHKGKLVEIQAKAIHHQHEMQNYRDRLKTMLVEATQCLAAVQGHIKKQGQGLEQIKATLEKLVTATTKQEETSRRYVNSVIAHVSRFLLATRDPKAAEKEGMKKTQFVAKHAESVTACEKIATKVAAIHKETKAIVERTIGKHDPQMLKTFPVFKPILKEIDSKVGGLEDYAGHAAKHLVTLRGMQGKVQAAAQSA